MWDRLRESFQHAPRTLRLVFRSSPGGTVTLGALTLLAATIPLGVAYIGKAIVDAVVAHARDAAVRWVLVELALVVAQSLVQRALLLVRTLLGARLSIDINVLILEKALGLDLLHFEDPDFYDRLMRARREAAARPLSVVTEAFQLLQNVITLAGYVALLLRFSGVAVLGLVIGAVPATIIEMKFSSTAFRTRVARSPEARQMNYLEYVLANDHHAKEIRLFGIGPLLFDRYKALGESFYVEDRRIALQRAGWAWALSLFGTLAFYGSYVVMAIAAALGALSLGDMVLYVMAFRQGQLAFQAILTALGGMYEDNLYMSNLFEYLSVAAAPPATLEPAAPEVEEGIRFVGVGFRYSGKDEWAIRDLDLFIPRGHSLALVGHNGAGKTTFIKLLTRLYEPTEGRILLDGKDVRAWDLDALRRRIGVVFQDYNQYQFKVRDNIGLGSVEHRGDDARIERAARRGGAAEVVEGLRDGIETQLGRWFKDGVELSGGQWQKIALSRAFMREEADILVLDEPTAALDAVAEHAVFERFKTLAEGRTTILVSHRFPTVRMADTIVVLEGGRILEQGTHDALVAEGGRYAQLFALQARGYM